MDTPQMLALMGDLDEGTNLFGPLSAEVRARLFAVVDTRLRTPGATPIRSSSPRRE